MAITPHSQRAFFRMLAGRQDSSTGLVRLTNWPERCEQVVRLLAQGYTTAQIAELAAISATWACRVVKCAREDYGARTNQGLALAYFVGLQAADRKAWYERESKRLDRRVTLLKPHQRALFNLLGSDPAFCDMNAEQLAPWLDRCVYSVHATLRSTAIALGVLDDRDMRVSVVMGAVLQFATHPDSGELKPAWAPIRK